MPELDFSIRDMQNEDNNGYYEVIRRDEIVPLNDPQCEHSFKLDESDTIGDTVAWVCTKCHLGTFLPKGVSIT